MATDPRGRPPRRWLRRVVRTFVVLVSLALIAGSAIAGYRWAAFEPRQVEVTVVSADGRQAVLVDEGSPLAAALLEARVRVHDGRLLSTRDHVVLDPKLDPGTISLDGRPAELGSPLVAGSEVTVRDGEDSVEGTRAIDHVVPAPPITDVMRHVQERGTAGEAEQVVGERSGEVVSERVLLAPIAPRQTTRKVVALTFDDGPSATWTPQILEVLRQKGVHATFCEVGQEVDRHPEMTRAVVAAGHRLCNHTLNHDQGLRQADQARLDAQIIGGVEAFARAGQPAPHYYRAPGGFLSDAIVATAHGQDEAVLGWKVDTEDWKAGANALTILDKVLKEVDSGAIIIMHDFGGSDRSATVTALGLTIDILRAQGYQFTFPVIDRATGR